MGFNSNFPPKEDQINSYWVSDGLEPYYEKWIRQNPVLISAQTGRGKNHFIMEMLIPFALRTRQHVFLLSNRVALSVQQKKELLGALGLPNIYTDEQLREKENFGFVSVWSYQSVLQHIDEIERHDILLPTGYVVFDEVHFFLNDAPFNAYTELIFHRLIHAAQYRKRIYMTATPDNILPLINEYEQSTQIMNIRLSPEFLEVCQTSQSKFKEIATRRNVSFEAPVHVYTFKRDYSKYRITFFTNWDHLYANLQHASATNKWLCFVNNKDHQLKIQADLKGLQSSIQIDCFDASKKAETSNIWSKILEGKIPGTVLLSTSVIDNGVNIIDSGLHNIVLEATDKVSFLQMLGRKRAKDDEIINVFVRVPSETELKRKLYKINEYLQVFQPYHTSLYDYFQKTWPEMAPEKQRLFRFEQTLCGFQLVPNQFAYKELAIQYSFYSSLLFKMQHSDRPQDVYPSVIFEWLEFSDDKKTISWIGDESEKSAIKDLVALLEENSSLGVSKESQKDFYERFMKIIQEIAYPRPEQRDDKRSPIATINRHLNCLLDKLPFKYELKKELSFWHVEKQEKR